MGVKALTTDRGSWTYRTKLNCYLLCGGSANLSMQYYIATIWCPRNMMSPTSPGDVEISSSSSTNKAIRPGDTHPLVEGKATENQYSKTVQERSDNKIRRLLRLGFSSRVPISNAGRELKSNSTPGILQNVKSRYLYPHRNCPKYSDKLL
jgi:hypothetical protein